MVKKYVGVLGAGKFGTTIAYLLAKKTDVLIYAKYAKQVIGINQNHNNLDYNLPKNIVATGNLQEIANNCDIIFPVVPSEKFRTLIQEITPYLTPRHILIHGTKGLDFEVSEYNPKTLSKNNIYSMSEVIEQETNVLRIGCLSGPNLSSEIMDGLPTASVLASKYDEVIEIGQKLLASSSFFIFGSREIRGAEFAGAYKNIIALGSGILYGLKMGKNIEALLITRGLSEMIDLGSAVGIKSRAFLGTAGIGDLIATATSTNSRNFSFGMKLAKGKNLKELIDENIEVVEGLRTLKIAKYLINYYKIKAPITETLFKVFYEHLSPKEAIRYLMRYPYVRDVDFL